MVVRIWSNWQILYVTIYTTYPEKFIEATDISLTDTRF